MAEPASISTGIAARYATAVFDLAREENALATLESDTETLGALLAESAELRAMIASPLYRRAEQGAAITAVADKAGLSRMMRSVLGLMADHRRLFTLPQFVTQLRNRIAAEKGEVTADVRSAKPLSDAQTAALTDTLAASAGKTVKLNAIVDERLIGGLVVKLGSRMIDSSIRSKLNALQNAMKEVG